MGIVVHYCINCGTALEPRMLEGREHEACPRCDFVLWRDPKVVTMVIVTDAAGHIVLGRRSIPPGVGLWCLPGGFVNDDEHPRTGAARECREEIGTEVEIRALLDVYHIAKMGAPSMVAIAYTGVVRAGGRPAVGDEMLEVAAFPPDRLPELAFPSHRRALRDWQARSEVAT
jgi:8-oxo-dGTP diphosphatase